jgi:hypothetical protein
MNEDDVLAYLELRRHEVTNARRRAVQQPGEWAADGAIHELDRLEGWLNLRGQQERAEALVREADAAWRRCRRNPRPGGGTVPPPWPARRSIPGRSGQVGVNSGPGPRGAQDRVPRSLRVATIKASYLTVKPSLAW